jgi:hypothetical protein
MTALFGYPEKAKFGRIIAKNKIYARAKPSRKIQENFTSQVDRIIWQYKLAPETVNLTAKKGLQEIEVLEIALKNETLDKNVLATIDKAIVQPIIFHLTYGDRVKVMAAYKRQNEADPSKRVVSKHYFESNWLPANSLAEALPVVLALENLYEYILRTIIPIAPQTNETLPEHILRMESLIVKEKESARLESRLRTEKQFNRKVELNTKLRKLNSEIEQLK